MSQWVFCHGDFMEADVIRWKEPVWEKRGPRQNRWLHIGDLLVTAEVLREDEKTGWVKLLVLYSDVVLDKTERKIIRPLEAALKKGQTLKIDRPRKKIEKGRPQRMLWKGDGESIRPGLVRQPERAHENRLRD